MDFSSPVLAATRGRLVARFGARVEPWWEQLPGALAELARRWEIVVDEPIGRGGTSLVMRCRQVDGRSAVLKVTPDPELAGAEAWALRSWASSARVPQVWGYDATLGALLLEAIPGETPLSERRAPVAVGDAAALIGALHRSGTPAGADGVVSLAERVEFVFEHWIERHGRRGAAVTRAVPVSELRRGHQMARALAADAVAPVLLHGDLHPGNVLDGGERGWVAIDPRPCVGDAAFDTVDWVFWAAEDPRTWEPRSRELASALGVDRRRLWDWCAAFAALLAASAAVRDERSDRVEALLALGRRAD